MKLPELHDRLFEVLCVVDDICRRENVPYFLDGGTAIGAAREGDFIPWDDDMDIKILARDYPAFKAAMEKHLPEHMHFLEPDGFAPHFYDFTARIYDDRWLIRRQTPEDAFYGDLQNHVGTDIFTLTTAPVSPLAQKTLVLKSKVLYGMAMAHRYAVKDEKYTFLQKMQVTILRSVGRLVSFRRIYGWWKKAMWRWEGEDTGVLFTASYPLGWLRFFPAQWYESACDGHIRGRNFPLPAGYDQELRSLYGDYMTPHRDTSLYIQHIDEQDREEDHRR